MNDQNNKSRLEDFWDQYGILVTIVGYGYFCYALGFKKGKNSALGVIDHTIDKIASSFDINRF